MCVCYSMCVRVCVCVCVCGCGGCGCGNSTREIRAGYVSISPELEQAVFERSMFCCENAFFIGMPVCNNSQCVITSKM